MSVRPVAAIINMQKQAWNLRIAGSTGVLTSLMLQVIKYGYTQNLFPIVQGGTHKELRKESCEYIISKNATGNAIGGLSVGEPEAIMYEICDFCCDHLPEDKPRYLMGVGTPWNILECISLGIDMFDCVMPTRNGRNAMLFTTKGIINIDNKKWEHDFSPIDDGFDCEVSNYYSKSYLRHLLRSKEILGLTIASIHNLAFYLWLVAEAGKKIKEKLSFMEKKYGHPVETKTMRKKCPFLFIDKLLLPFFLPKKYHK